MTLVGLLGGSFDPIHVGHLIVGQALVETLGLDELRFVVAREQPLKRGHAAPAAARAEMVAAAVAAEPAFRVERLELEREGPSFTVDTLRELRRREPEARFVLCLGADAAADLPKWREPDAVASLAQVVSFARAGTPAPAHPAIARTVTVPSIEISATAIRARAREGRSIRYWVPDAVADYVAAHRLYRDGEGC